MKQSILIFFVCLFGTAISAQNATDALRYAYTTVGGTARTVGVGGAMGAIGGDFAAASTNPAGIGTYRASELVFSPGYYLSTVNSLLLNDKSTAANNQLKTNFHIDNLGVVLDMQPGQRNWKTANLALGYNRIANFNETFYFEGVSKGSIADRFVGLAQGKIPNDLNEFDAVLAYEAGAIYHPSTDNKVYTNDFIGNPDVKKSQTVATTGSMNELVFSVGGNYREKLNVGITLSAPIIEYKEVRTYNESDVTSKIPEFDKLKYVQTLSTSGGGVQLKLGAIYKVAQNVRLGAAVHTPTVLAFKDFYANEIEYSFTDAKGSQTIPSKSPDGEFEYQIYTPWKYMGNGAFFFNKFGFLTADVEYVNYGGARLDFTTNNTGTEYKDLENSANAVISSTLGSALNVRMGAEYALGSVRFRGGYNMYGSPYAKSSTPRTGFSAGIGLREQSFFIDAAYTSGIVKDTYIPYAVNTNQQEVSNSAKRSLILVTLGYKF
jgi:hypothetical protein